MKTPRAIAYTNLRAVITGAGFLKKKGRRVSAADLGVIEGPVHIVCEGEKIAKISKTLPTDARKINCTGLVATAAFVDSHTHALFGGSRWQEFFARWGGESYAKINETGGGIRKTFRDTKAASDAELTQRLTLALAQMHREGVRLVEIKSGYGATMAEELRLLRLLKKFASKKSGMKIKRTFLGLHAVPPEMSDQAWTDEAIATLETIAEDGLADFVDAFPEKGFFSIESAERYFAAALEHGIDIKIHADEITPMKASELGIRLGAVSIDHLQKISDDALKQLSSSNTVCTLLPATSFFMGLDFAPARTILDSGARVAFATDFNPGTAPDPSILFTAKLAASQMKATPAEIFCGLTFNAAAAVAADGERGLIAPKFVADILLWPCVTTDYVEEIILSGLLPVEK